MMSVKSVKSVKSVMSDMIPHVCQRLEETYIETRLPCGLRVLVCPKDRHTYHAAVTVGYGSMDRFAGREGGRPLPMGTAHFLEHKMFGRDPDAFDGSDSYDDDFAALGAESNAYTSHDRTVYYFSCTHHFSEALKTLLSMVSELYVTRETVARERDIIAEEIRMNTDDPWERCSAGARTALFGRHPVQEEICGSLSSIRRITPTVLQEAFDAFYRPHNMVLTVCGRVDPAEVVAQVQAIMESLSPKPPLPICAAAPRARLSPAAFVPRVTAYRQVAKPLFCIGVKYPDPPAGPAALWKRDMTVSVLCETLFSHGGNFYSDLFESGTVSPGTSYGFLVGDSAHLPPSFAYGYFDLSGECDHPDAVFAAFLEYVGRIRANGLSKADFERAKRVVYADFVATFDTTEDVASLLGSYAVDGLCAYDFFEVMDSITLEDVTDLFDRAFRDGQYTLSVVLPAETNE